MTRFSPAKHVVAREVGGEQVLLDMRSGEYFGLNTVGTVIWQAMESSARSVAELAGLVTGTFDVEPDVAAEDVRELLDDLAARGLVTTHPGD